MMSNWKFLLVLTAVAAVIDLSSAQPSQPLNLVTPAPVAGTPANTTTTPATTAPAQSAVDPAPTQPPDVWSGCVDYDDGETLIKLGKKTTICVSLASSTDWSSPPVKVVRLSFQPEADEYSRFHVPESYTDLTVNQELGSDNVTIHVASQKQLSFQRMFVYNDGETMKFYPYLTAIIDVSKGRVKGITWDDACLFCGGDRCDEITYDFNGNLGTRGEYRQPTKGCYHTAEECQVESSGKSQCDITVYVVWTGDDADGKAFQSSAFRFSAFPPQELKNRLGVNIPEVPDFGFGSDSETQQPATGST